MKFLVLLFAATRLYHTSRINKTTSTAIRASPSKLLCGCEEDELSDRRLSEVDVTRDVSDMENSSEPGVLKLLFNSARVDLFDDPMLEIRASVIEVGIVLAAEFIGTGFVVILAPVSEKFSVIVVFIIESAVGNVVGVSPALLSATGI